MKIALFGGSFNPIHSGHLDIINDLSNKFDQVWVIPSFISPGKTESFNEKDRLNMINIVIKEFDNVVLYDWEIKNKKVSYTSETIKHILKTNPEDQFTFIFGFDNVKTFDKWQEAEYIAKNVDLAAYYRGKKETHENVKNFNINLYDLIPTEISSTEIRRGDNLLEVNQEIIKYILINRLYIDDILSKYMNKERLEHSKDVANYAIVLAKAYGISSEKAYIAGILHDIGKQLPDAKTDEILSKMNITESIPNPVKHQFTGSYIAQHSFGINDKEILSSISKHTSADSEMSSLDKLIYIADFACPSRDVENKHSKEIRAMVDDKSLDEVFNQTLIYSYEHIKAKTTDIYKRTVNAYNTFI